MRIKIFTHNDLDGINCIVTLKKLMPKVYVNYSILQYDGNSEKAIREYVEKEEYKKFDYTFITDLNFTNTEFLKWIGSMCDNIYGFVFIDHHKNTEEFFKPYNNKRIFVKSELSYSGKVIPQCGSTLLYNWLTNRDNFIRGKDKMYPSYKNEEFEVYLNLVRSYDTWTWKENNLFMAVDLDRIFKFIGFFNFIKFLFDGTLIKIEKDENDKIKIEFTEIITEIINTLKFTEKKYIDTMISNIKSMKIDKIPTAVIFAENSTNLISDRIFDNPENEYKIVMTVDINNGNVSLRSRDDNIDVSIIATEFGGGGHVHASGFNMFEEKAKDIKSKIKRLI